MDKPDNKRYRVVFVMYGVVFRSDVLKYIAADNLVEQLKLEGITAEMVEYKQ